MTRVPVAVERKQNAVITTKSKGYTFETFQSTDTNLERQKLFTETEESVISRFQGDEGKKRLITALQSQAIVHGDEKTAAAIAEKATLKQLAPGTEIIRQDGVDSDLYLLVCGAASVFVNGREVAKRTTGHHIGEMALIDPTAKRSATVKTTETSVVAILTEPVFSEIADLYPKLWRRIAVELADRLRERGKFHRQPNDKPMVFIGSSKEALAVAEKIQAGIVSDDCVVKLWTDGIFGASATTIESLAAVVETFDFGIIILSPDDMVTSRGTAAPAPRDNAVFELGLLMGGFGRSRTYIVRPQGLDIKIPSDLLGITCLGVDSTSADTLSKTVTAACDQLRAKFTSLGPR